MAGGHAWRGGCMAGGTCVAGGVWQILRDTVNERAVRILLECILVDIGLCLGPVRHFSILY